MTYKDKTHEVGTYAHEHDELRTDNFMKVYSPTEGDANEIFPDADGRLDGSRGRPVDKGTVGWWKLNCGRVLGIYDSRLIE